MPNVPGSAARHDEHVKGARNHRKDTGMRRRVILALFLAALWAGCGNEDEPTTPSPTGSCCVEWNRCRITTQADCAGYWVQGGRCPWGSCLLPQSSPTSVLRNLQRAYEDRNLDQYEELFADDWEDQSILADKTVVTTWGRIKFLFS
jgi:hypothetical protein